MEVVTTNMMDNQKVLKESNERGLLRFNIPDIGEESLTDGTDNQ